MLKSKICTFLTANLYWLGCFPDQISFGGDYKDFAADNWSILENLWSRFVSDSGETGLDGYNCPRGYLEKCGPKWDTVRHRFLRWASQQPESVLMELTRKIHHTKKWYDELSQEFLETFEDE